MLITRYLCSMLNVDHVQLLDGEQFTNSDTVANAKVYGVHVISGAYEVTAADDPQFVSRVFAPTGDLVPNEITCGATVRAQGDTTWFCFSQNDSVRRNVTQMDVAGTATLPAGFGFFVVSGTVQADGKTANQFQFFKPRQTDIAVTGQATLVLVQ